MYKILAINPGSTSTKFAVYEDEKQIHEFTVRHPHDEIAEFNSVLDQFDYRYELILKKLKEEGISLHEFSAIVGRGGMLPPVQSGVYAVNEKMLDVLREKKYGQHASNLGAFLAMKMADETENKLAYIVDPVAVDEFEALARISGLPDFPRRSTFHALNHKAIGRKHAAAVGKKYEDLNLVIAHLGGGITVGTHKKGRVIDVNQGLDGYGPFSPERSGTLDAGKMVSLCFSGKYAEADIRKRLAGEGGIYAHLGSSNLIELEEKANNGEEHVKLILQACGYTTAKEIGSMLAVLGGKCDGVVLTGGVAYCKIVVDQIKKMIEPLAAIYIYPGEDELGSLAAGALRALRGEPVKEFTGE